MISASSLILVYSFFASAKAYVLDELILKGANKATLAASLSWAGEHLSSILNGRNNQMLTPLHVAICAGNFEACEYLVETGVDLNKGDGSDATALHYAASANDVRLVNLLLRGGSDVNHSDKQGRIALHIAAKCGFVQVFRALLLNTEKNKRNRKDKRLWTVFHYAADGGHTEIVEILSHTEWSMNDHEMTKGMTPLHMAIVRNHEQVAFVLIDGITDELRTDCNVEIGYAARYGRKSVLLALISVVAEYDENAWLSAINFAKEEDMLEVEERMLACYNSAEMVKALIIAGVNLQATDEFGENAQDIASYFGNHAVYSLISKEMAVRFSRSSAQEFLPHIHYEITDVKPNLDRIRRLLSVGNVDERDYLGRTAAHLAVKVNNLDILKDILIPGGCDLTLQDNVGNTPLHLVENVEMAHVLLQAAPELANIANAEQNLPLHVAVYKQLADVVYVLGAATADLGHVNNRRASVLDLTAELGNEPMAKCLLKCGARWKIKRGRDTPLHFSAAAGEMKMTRLFVKYGLDKAATNGGGMLPAHYAVSYGEDAELIRELLRGVPPDSTDIFGYSFVHYAAISGKARGNVIKMLAEEYGAPLDWRSFEGKTPLHMAARLGYVENVRALVECGADVTSATPAGKTPLHYAVSYAQDATVESVAILTQADRNILRVNNNAGYTPVQSAMQLSHHFHLFMKVVVAMELTPEDCSPIVLIGLLSNYFYNELPEIVNFEEYVMRGIRNFRKDMGENFVDLTKSVANGLGIVYAFAAASYPELSYFDVSRMHVESYYRKQDEHWEAVKAFETFKNKGAYFNQLRYMLVESFMKDEKRFEGTFMKFVPQELIDDILIGVANNGNVWERVEVIANSMMLTLKGKEETYFYNEYLWGKMARLSEVIVPSTRRIRANISRRRKSGRK